MKHLITLTFTLGATLTFAQPQIINSGFETWQDPDAAVAEPEEWSSVKTSDASEVVNNLAPQLCWPSTDAHTGTYSANLRTVDTFVGPASGLMTCGRVHAAFDPAQGYVFTDPANSPWNQSLTSRPDSIIGWYKATVVGADFPTLKAALHVGDAKIPENGTLGNWVGGADWNAPSANVGEWTRFSVPFNYFSTVAPSWALVVITSGNGLVTEVGSEVWYDDIALIYNVIPVPSETMAYVTSDAGFALNVDFSTGGEPVAATDFVAELSDANGDWSAPVVIGSLNTDTSAGTIPCMIPAGTPSGTGYLSRVTNASPYYAPVVAGITIDLNTGIAAVGGADASVRSQEGGILVDLSRATASPVLCEVFDVRGGLLARATYTGGSRHLVPFYAPGLYTVRLTGGAVDGTHRVMVR